MMKLFLQGGSSDTTSSAETSQTGRSLLVVQQISEQNSAECVCECVLCLVPGALLPLSQRILAHVNHCQLVGSLHPCFNLIRQKSTHKYTWCQWVAWGEAEATGHERPFIGKMKDSAVGCCESEQRELRGSFLHFKIYCPNQTLAFGLKCSVNDESVSTRMLWFIAQCWDRERWSRGCLMSPPPSPLVTKTNKRRIFWMCVHPSGLFINTDNDVLYIAALVNILPGAPAVLAVAVFT